MPSSRVIGESKCFYAPATKGGAFLFLGVSRRLTREGGSPISIGEEITREERIEG